LATEQLYNRLENAPPASLALAQQPQMSLGPYIIPQPPPLSNADVFECKLLFDTHVSCILTNTDGNGAINRVFESLSALDDITVKGNKPSFNRRAGSNQDRESWVTVVARLATRSLTGLEGGNSAQVKQEVSTTFSLSNTIRDAIHLYVIGDFRKRIDLAISWLTEEWYNDQLHVRSSGAVTPCLTYERLVLKLIDALVPYLDAKDQKILIRFLSEIPQVNKDILERIKRLARDPERVPLAVNSI
jgi:symplekin